jgi:hypothetical protein
LGPKGRKRRGRTGQAEQDRQNWKGSTGQAEQNCPDMTARKRLTEQPEIAQLIRGTGQAEKDRQNKTAKWDFQDRTARVGWPGQVCQHRTARIRQKGEESQERTARTVQL